MLFFNKLHESTCFWYIRYKFFTVLSCDPCRKWSSYVWKGKILFDELFEDVAEFAGVVTETVELRGDRDNIRSYYFDTNIGDTF